MIDGQRTVGLPGIAEATIEQMFVDYQMLVKKGVLANGDFVRDAKGRIKNPPSVKTHKEYQTVNQVQSLLNDMTKGELQLIIDDACLKLNAHKMLRDIGFSEAVLEGYGV